MLITKINRKGRITIPKEIREFLDLKEKDQIVFLKRDGSVVIRPLRGTILDIRGAVKPKKRPEDFDIVRDHVKAIVGRKISDQARNTDCILNPG
jgi:AbrB family looped-hinge helix DNA binding protein